MILIPPLVRLFSIDHFWRKKEKTRVAFGFLAYLIFLSTFLFWFGRKKFVYAPPAGFGFLRECFSCEGRNALG